MSKTIEISRELAEYLKKCAEQVSFMGRGKELDELRALLAAPVVERQELTSPVTSRE